MFLSPSWGRILKLVCLLWILNTLGQLLTASLFPCCSGTNARACSFSLAWSLADFLCTLTGHLTKPTHIAIWSTQNWPQCWCGGGTWSTGVPLGQLWDLQVNCSLWLMCGLLNRIWETARISIPLMSSDIIVSAAVPTASCPPAHDSVLRIRWDRTQFLWQCPPQVGKPTAHFHKLSFPCRINHRSRKIFLGPKLCHLEGGVM